MKLEVEIVLMNNQNEFIKSYNWFEIPQVNDKIALESTKIFIVEQRLLPSTNQSNRIVLFGEIKEMN